METRQRMSRISALFWSIALVLITVITTTGILAGTGMMIVNGKASRVLDLAENGVEQLPDLIMNVSELIEGLPPMLSEPLNARRAPGYLAQLDVQVDLVPSADGQWLRPAVRIENKGDEMVSLLAMRVVALDEQQHPVCEWTEVVATPLTFDDNDWRGPLMPGNTRHALLPYWSFHKLPRQMDEKLTAVYEITDVLVYQPAVQTALAD